jgi:hypothetical protein
VKIKETNNKVSTQRYQSISLYSNYINQHNYYNMHHYNITYYSVYGVALLDKCLGFHSSVAEIPVLLGWNAMSHPRRTET